MKVTRPRLKLRGPPDGTGVCALLHSNVLMATMTRYSLLALLALAACGYSNDGYGGGPSMGGGNGTDSVVVSNNAFTPATVHPDIAGNVKWVWKSGGVTHNVTFENAINGSGDKSSGTFTVPFTTPGTYRFRCTIHSTAFGNGMHGTVVVP